MELLFVYIELLATAVSVTEPMNVSVVTVRSRQPLQRGDF